MDTPVLLLLFNRPSHTEAALERLKAVGATRLFIHIDGARAHKVGELEAVEKSIALVNGIDWNCTVKILARDRNFGCRNGVSDAISWFFSEEESGIILEDDSSPHPDFFRYATELLDRYKDNESILHVGGLNLAYKSTENAETDYFFSHFCFVWGWATWKRAWQKMDLDLNGFESFYAQNQLKMWLPNPLARAYLYEKFRATKARENQSWAYAWFFSILKNNGFCVTPRVNLVENTGIGSEGATHTATKDRKLMAKATGLSWPLRHPKKAEAIAPTMENQFFYTSQKSKWALLLWFLRFKIRLK